MGRHWFALLEEKELLDKLRAEIGEETLEKLLCHEIFTRAGRLNKSAAARVLNVKTTKAVETILERCREVLKGLD